MNTNLRDPIAEMEATLRAEADLLRSGQLDQISALDQRKRLAWSALQASSPDSVRVGLDQIRHLATENARMLMAARQGVEAVRKLRETLEAGPAPLKTYGADGRKSSFSLSTSGGSQTRSV